MLEGRIVIAGVILLLRDESGQSHVFVLLHSTRRRRRLSKARTIGNTAATSVLSGGIMAFATKRRGPGHDPTKVRGRKTLVPRLFGRGVQLLEIGLFGRRQLLILELDFDLLDCAREPKRGPIVRADR